MKTYLSKVQVSKNFIALLLVCLLQFIFYSTCVGQQAGSYKMNSLDKNLHSSIQAISELPWLKELFQKEEIIIFSSMKMKKPKDHFGIVLFQNGQYVLIGLEKNEEDFFVSNVTSMYSPCPDKGYNIFNEIRRLNASSFFGEEYSKHEYISYLYIAYYLHGELLGHWGMPFLYIGSNVKVKYPISGNAIFSLWMFDDKLFEKSQ